MTSATRTTLTLAESAIVAAICFGLPIALSVHAVFRGFRETPFTDGGFEAMAGIEAALAAAALFFLRARKFDIASLAPRPTWRGGAMGLGLFFAAWIAGALVTLPFASQWESQPIARIMAEARLSTTTVVVFALVNGTFEEVFLLGALVRGLRGYGLSLAIGAPLLVRVLYHLYQGPLGALWVLAFGLVFTLAYLRSPVLWPPVFAHVLWDIVPFAST